MGEVGLPGLVGQVGFEAQVGRPGSLPRFGGHQAVTLENLPDGGGCSASSVVAFEVCGNGVWAGIVTGLSQFASQSQNLFLNFGRGPRRAGQRSSGSRLESLPPAMQVTGHKGVDPPVGDPVIAGDFCFRAALDNDTDHDDAVLMHPSRL